MHNTASRCKIRACPVRPLPCLPCACVQGVQLMSGSITQLHGLACRVYWCAGEAGLRGAQAGCMMVYWYCMQMAASMARVRMRMEQLLRVLHALHSQTSPATYECRLLNGWPAEHGTYIAYDGGNVLQWMSSWMNQWLEEKGWASKDGCGRASQVGAQALDHMLDVPRLLGPCCGS